jgi:hypothetical protein
MLNERLGGNCVILFQLENGFAIAMPKLCRSPPRLWGERGGIDAAELDSPLFLVLGPAIAKWLLANAESICLAPDAFLLLFQ